MFLFNKILLEDDEKKLKTGKKSARSRILMNSQFLIVKVVII